MRDTPIVAMLTAVQTGDLAEVGRLLAENPSLATSTDENGATPLHLAALGGHREIAAALIDAGADVNARDGEFGATPAGWAIEHLRQRGGLLAIEIDSAADAIATGDTARLKRLLAVLPTLHTATDVNGVPLSDLAQQSKTAEIAALFGSEKPKDSS